jgi:hypothetical protein
MSDNQQDSAPVENQEQDAIDQVTDVKTENEPQKLQKVDESAKAMIKRLKLKVDGEEFEEDYDLGNEEQLKRDLQLARAAKKRMAEAQGLKKEAYQIIEQYKNDPAGLIKALGPKGYDIAEQILVEKLQSEMMTPEQRKMAEYEQRLSAYEKAEKDKKEREEQEQMQALEMKQAEHYQKVIIDALNKTGLPKEPQLAKRAAFLLKKNLELGLDLSPEELAQELKNEVVNTLKSIAGSSEASQLLELLGPDLAKKIRKHDLEQLKSKKMQGTKSLTQSGQPSFQKPKKGYMTQEEWQAELDKRLQSID